MNRYERMDSGPTDIIRSRDWKTGFWMGLSAGLAISGLTIILYVLMTGTEFCVQ